MWAQLWLLCCKLADIKVYQRSFCKPVLEA